ncbi:arsinothricin resistance N-acetyltransferase ArsN1 family A [Sulfobacillus thermosulfidooxidans]|uniref:arsinothricin resistance N-acetyltransferase ArsN1 family A n=1 Tax=Sulfobacillus thermosulfidooxidans TaxID=28034 RepID=UPI000A555D47|nr:arsinothricin resistance N-acetyltransferase ArsN1 family A [Sulfobacillus thermosulfidooxidans]
MDGIAIEEQQGFTVEDTEIRELWSSAGLPFPSGPCKRQWFILTTTDNRHVGVIGVEPYGSAALLRSLVVSPEYRGKGLGSKLVWYALGQLQATNVQTVFLVTDTAEKFFREWNFAVVGREKVPAPMRTADEFSGACPHTATIMQLSLLHPLVRIRRAHLSDSPAIARIYNQGIADRVATFETAMRTSEERRQWLQARSNRYAVLVGETMDNHVVGWLSLNPFSTRQAYHAVADISIYVERNLRGQGIGKRLLRTGIEWAREHEFHKLVLTLFPENEAARHLYLQAGFRTVGILHEQAQLEGRWRNTELMEYLILQSGDGIKP